MLFARHPAVLDFRMLAPTFVGPDLKLERSGDLLDLFMQSEDKFWRKNELYIDMSADADPDGCRYAKIKIRKNPPEILHLFTAEIIYHLRSALDQIAVELATFSGVQDDKLSKIYFPCAVTLDELKKTASRTLPGVTSELKDLIVAQKPYLGGNDDLYRIFKLAIIDKHLRLIPTTSAATRITIRNLSFNVVSQVSYGDCDLIRGVRIAEIDSHSWFEPRGDGIHLEANGVITFGNTGVCDGEPIAEILSRGIRAVAKTLKTLRDHLPGNS